MSNIQSGKLYKLQKSVSSHHLLVVENNSVVDIINYGDVFIVLEVVKVIEFDMTLYKVLTKNGFVGKICLWESELNIAE